MRTIKFRVWNPDDLKMEFPLVFSICMNGKLQPLIKCSDGNRAYKDYPINQFIGLTDKNGVEIYENDIIKFYAGEKFERVEIYTVSYNAPSFYGKSKIQTVNNIDSLSMELLNGRIEVIGNIYENPELL